MNLNDLKRVLELAGQLGYPGELKDFETRFQSLVALPSHSLWVYADMEVEGWIHLERVLDLIEEEKVEIKALVVSETSRGKGIGKALLIQAREWAKTYRVSTIYLSCNIIREKAHAFYEREGFKKVKTSYFYEAEIE